MRGEKAMRIEFKNFKLSWKYPFFRKKPIVCDIVSYTYPTQSPAYVYNAGEDFEGTWAHLFGQTNVIKGGIVTRIEEATEWIETGRSDFRGAALQIRVQKDPITQRIIDQQEGITHSALELAINLESWSQRQIVVLPFWNGKDVDIAKINELIASAMEERVAKTAALTRRKEEWARLLKDAMLSALELEMKRKGYRETELTKNKAYGEFDKFNLDIATQAALNAEYREYVTDFDTPNPERLTRMKQRLADAGIVIKSDEKD